PPGQEKSSEYGLALLIMARARQDLGELRKAAKKCREAIDLFQSLKAHRLWQAYAALGEVQMALGDSAVLWDRAQQAYTEAIHSYEQRFAASNDPVYRTMVLTFLADAHVKNGDPEKALAVYHDVLKKASPQDVRLKEIRSKAMGRIGAVYSGWGRHGEALAHLNQARRLAEEDRNPRLKIAWLKIIGDVYAARGRVDTALDYYEQALSQTAFGVERMGAQWEDERYSYFDEQLEGYEALVEWLLVLDKQQPERGCAERALDYVETARAEATLQRLFQSRIVEKLLSGNLADPFLKKLAELKEAIRQKHSERQVQYERMKTLNHQNPDGVRGPEHAVET